MSRAAELCNVAQPSLTRAVKKLEAELGGPLFLRARSGTRLTELGTRMRPYLEGCFRARRRNHREGFPDASANVIWRIQSE